MRSLELSIIDSQYLNANVEGESSSQSCSGTTVAITNETDSLTFPNFCLYKPVSKAVDKIYAEINLWFIMRMNGVPPMPPPNDNNN